MHWKEHKSRKWIDVSGERFDLSHLQDLQFTYVIPASNSNPEVAIKALIQFSSHCVSWGPKSGASIDFDEHGQDRIIIDEKNVWRCFCEIRHGLSSHLPGVMRELPDQKCFFTGRENWLVARFLTRGGEEVQYEIYFNVSRQSSTFLRVYVESAYVRTGEGLATQPNPRNLRKMDKIKGRLLLLKKLRNQPIRKPQTPRPK